MSWWGKKSDQVQQAQRKEEYLDDPYQNNDLRDDEISIFNQKENLTDFQAEFDSGEDGTSLDLGKDWAKEYGDEGQQAVDEQRAPVPLQPRQQQTVADAPGGPKKEYKFDDLLQEARGNAKASGLLCGVTGFANACQGCFLGAVFGGISGYFEAQSFKLQGQLLRNHVQMTSVRHAKELGIIVGVTTGVKCGMYQLRGTRDMVNSFVAGAAAGAILNARRGLPAGSIITNACFWGAGLVFFDSLGSFSSKGVVDGVEGSGQNM